MSFESDIQGKNTQLFPVVEIDGIWYSTNNVTVDGNYCKPILMNIPSIKESVDVESRKFKISNVTLQFSNVPFWGVRFSDQLLETSLINTEATIYFKSPSTTTIPDDENPLDTDMHEAYKGIIRRISHDDEKVSVELEDLTEQKAHKDLPSKTGEDYFKSTIKVFPIVYGEVDKSPTLITDTSSGFIFDFGEIDTSLLFDNGQHIGYKLGEDIRINADYKDIKGYPEFQYNNGVHNPLFLYEDGQYHRVLENAEATLIYDEDGVNLYQVGFQYETGVEYSENYIDLISRFDTLSETPTETNWKNLPSGGIVQCYKEQKFIQWVINSPYQQAGFMTPSEGFNLSPQSPTGESNALTISGDIDTNLDFSDLNNMYFDNCLIKFRIQSVPSEENSLIYTYFHPTLTTYLLAVTTSGFQIVFRVLNDKGNEVHGETITVGASDISSTGAYEKQVDSDFTFDRKFEASSNLFTFEWSVVAGYLTSGQAVNLLADIDDFYISNLYNLNFINKDFYVDVKGRINTFDDHPELNVEEFIQNPIDIIYDLVRNELGQDAIDENEYTDALYSHSDWKFGFSQTEKINSKKLIQEIAKSTKCFPKFKNDGTFGFNTIKDSYTVSDIVQGEELGDYENATLIKESEVISYSFKKTKPEQIYTKVDVQYNKDYAQDSYLKRTDIIEVEGGDYYGIDDVSLEFESDYIRDKDTADALTSFLSEQYKNDHLLFNLKLPLQYVNLEIGDLVKFRELLGGKAFGIDYRKLDAPNNQYYYPLFMVTATTKNLDSVSIECMQLHNLTGSVASEWTDDIVHEDGTEGLFYFPDSEPIVIIELPEEEPVENLVNEIVIPPNSIAYFILSEAEYSSLPASPNSLWQLMYLPRFLPKLPESFIVDDIGNGIISINSGTHEELNAPMEIANVEDWYSTPESPYVCMRMDFAQSLEDISSPTKSVLFKDINAINEQHDMNMYFDSDEHTPNMVYSDTKVVALTNFSSETITYTPTNQINLISLDVGVATNPFDPTSPPELVGDTNLDGFVNVLDMVAMVSFILNETTLIGGIASADFNQDGVIDILDIVQLVSSILEQQ